MFFFVVAHIGEYMFLPRNRYRQYSLVLVQWNLTIQYTQLHSPINKIERIWSVRLMVTQVKPYGLLYTNGKPSSINRHKRQAFVVVVRWQSDQTMKIGIETHKHTTTYTCAGQHNANLTCQEKCMYIGHQEFLYVMFYVVYVIFVMLNELFNDMMVNVC